MDFDFSQEQYMFQETTRGFLKENYGLDKVRAKLDGDGADRTLWEGLIGTGIFSMLVPEEHGGMGMSFVDLSLLLEEYGRALVPSPVPETLAATDVITHFGTDAQKKRLLPSIAEGRLRIVPALIEAESGFDPGEIALTAIPDGSRWTVHGRKILVPQAATADLVLLAIRFGTGGPLGLAMVEINRKGISLREHSTLDAANRFHEVELNCVTIIDDDVVGGTPVPASVARLFDASGMIAATMMTGICGKVLDDTVAYVGQRTQFDRPVGSFQAIKHRCADMAVAIDASRSAAYYAAWALARNTPEAARAVSTAKSYCGDTARFVCNEGIQLHGGVGFTWELGLHLYLRRAKMLEYAYGDANYHRERVVAETLMELGVA